MSQDQEQSSKNEQTNVTQESGFSDRVDDLGPIGSEQPVTGLGAATNGHAVLNGASMFIQNFGDVPPDLSITSHVDELDLLPGSVSAASGSDVVGASQLVGNKGTVLKRRVSASELSSSDESLDLEAALQKNKMKRKDISKLKKELDATKENFSMELKQQKKGNETLIFKLTQKEKEVELLKESHRVEMELLQEKVQKKDEEVQKVKEQLAETEKNSNTQKMGLLKHVQKLQEECKQLISHNEQEKDKYEQQIEKLELSLEHAKIDAKKAESELAELHVEVEKSKLKHKKKRLRLREEIVELREKILAMRDQESKIKLEEAEARVELEREKRRGSLSVSEVEQLKQQHKEELSNIQEEFIYSKAALAAQKSISVSKEEHEAVLKAQRSNSIPKEEHEATVMAKDVEINKLKNVLASQ